MICQKQTLNFAGYALFEEKIVNKKIFLEAMCVDSGICKLARELTKKVIIVYNLGLILNARKSNFKINVIWKCGEIFKC
jgi:hypothetical protein